MRPLRLLVTIASFGQKNINFLEKIIREYRSMSMDVEVIVTSEAPKALDLGVKVVVGLPTRNPRSLPFAHKRILAQNVNRYDLFIYTEDDIHVEEENIRAFLRATPFLEPEEVAGHIRYEIGKGDTYFLPDVHGAFHWMPDTVARRAEYTVAEFTNEHAGFYILTQAQLRRAIASGNYLCSPYEGRYGMQESAATDPFTRCGLRRVICISALDDFLIHHMSNRYVGQLGISLNAFKEQIQTLMAIRDAAHPASTLCQVESKVLRSYWSKNYYEQPDTELLDMVSGKTATVLSVGCGWGATEVKLAQRGSQVTALPLDSVIGAAAARLGIEIVYGKIEDGLKKLGGRKFDCVVITNLLHLFPDPWLILEQCAPMVSKGGVMVVAGPNFNAIRTLVKRALGWGDFSKLHVFSESGVHVYSVGRVMRELVHAGLEVAALRWVSLNRPQWCHAGHSVLGRFIADKWIVTARSDHG